MMDGSVGRPASEEAFPTRSQSIHHSVIPVPDPLNHRASPAPPTSTTTYVCMSFWRPGTVAPGSSIDRDAAASTSGAGEVGAVTGRVAQVAVSERRKRLPITKQRKLHRRLII